MVHVGESLDFQVAGAKREEDVFFGQSFAKRLEFFLRIRIGDPNITTSHRIIFHVSAGLEVGQGDVRGPAGIGVRGLLRWS